MPEGEYLQYGGQAIIEGIMMRSPHYFSVACRAPNGKIILQTEALEKTWIGRQKWLKAPFLRGTFAILDAIALGNRAMKFAGNVQMGTEYQPVEEGAESAIEHIQTGPEHQRIQNITIGVALILGLAIGIFIFNMLPNLIAQWTQSLGWKTDVQTNIVTEVIKIIFFLGYIWAIGTFFKDIKEVFKYHGAEHQAINVIEAGEELTMENCLNMTRLHPRCGTSFAIIVLLVGFAVFTFVPRNPFHLANNFAIVGVRIVMEVMLLPIIAGVSYELLRIAGKMKNKTLVTILFWPGLMTQYLSTRPPEPKHTEVSRVALMAVLLAEETGELATEPETVLSKPVEDYKLQVARA